MSHENVVTDMQEERRVAAPENVFSFDPQSYKDEFQSKGYVHIKDAVTPEFIAIAREQIDRCLKDDLQCLSARAFKNKKEQYLFEFPEDNTLLRGAMDTISTVTGMRRETLALSERHVNVYVSNADPRPPAHKDRFASTVSVGIPLYMPEESIVALYPDQSRDVNRFDSAEDWRSSFATAGLPENVLKDVEPTKLPVGVGDVVMFLGSRIYHGRFNSADAIILYLKLNDMRLDPLGEDPFMLLQRNASLEILANKTGRDLLASTIEVSPRLIRISRHYTRDNWNEVLQAQMAGEKPFLLSEDDLALVNGVHGQCSVRELFAQAGVSAADEPDRLDRIRRLGELGGIDFLS